MYRLVLRFNHKLWEEVYFRHLAIENYQNPIFQMEITEENCQDLFSSETIVYLTPDAEEGWSQWRFQTYIYSGHEVAHLYLLKYACMAY